jgi:LacI family transcriptional regulator
MSVTIADIAKEARVSKATVSRVLNDRAEGVGAETRLRVKEVMRRLDFTPSGAARDLATGRSRCIGLVIPDIIDPFAPLMIRGIEATLRGLGYGLFLCDSENDLEREKEQLRLLAERRVEGVILNPALSGDADQVELLERRLVPYVLLDRGVESDRSVPGVYTDNRAGARMGVEYLLSGGARRLAFLNGPEGLSVSRLREAGVEDAFRAAKLDVMSITRGSGDYTVGSGERLIDGVLGEGAPSPASWVAASPPPFDAVFAANDRMAIGAVRALRRRGIDVPGTVEVVGFDDIELASLVEPPLTTVAQPAFEMGQQAARMLLRTIAGKRQLENGVLLDPKLVVRGTTRPRANGPAPPPRQ